MNDLQKEILAFRDARNWKQFHTPKDLAISISLEAAELLEVFQWSAEDMVVEEKKAQMKDELADVIIYCMMMTDALGVDVEEIVRDKMIKNGAKYDAKKFYGSKKKYSELEI